MTVHDDTTFYRTIITEAVHAGRHALEAVAIANKVFIELGLVYPPDKHQDRVTADEMMDQWIIKSPPVCADCGHPEGSHYVDQGIPKCVDGCQCQGFEA